MIRSPEPTTSTLDQQPSNRGASRVTRRVWRGALFGMVFCFILGVVITQPGCNVVAPIAYAIEGPPSISAQYTLPQKRIVVFIDDRGSIIPRTRLRRTMAKRTTEDLLVTKRLVPAAVDSNAAARVVMAEDTGNLLSIDEIGRRVGAEIVIYIRPLQFSTTSVGMPRPMAMMGVKVIDCATGERLFPTGAGGPEHMVTATMAIKPGSRYETRDAIEELEDSLADFAGLRAAQVFYKHELNPLDGELSR